MAISKQLPSGIEVRIRQDLSEGSRGSTTLTIDPVITKSGYRVTMADIGDRGFGKIDQNNPREEIISWTGMTDNGTTYTLTGIVWGVNFHDRTGNVSANMKRHISGANFSINTDMHYIADQFDLYVKKEDFNVSDNSIGWGDGTKDHNKVLEARNGAVSVPYIEYDETLNKWLISNDGVNSFDPEQGGSGVTAGDAISIIAGAVNVKTKEASGIHITDDEVAIEYQTNPGLAIEDNKLGVKIKENTGLVKDADGLWCDSIDPDNPVAQSPAQLIGGDDVVLQNFVDLKNGDNNGKFSVNIDGVDYNDLEIDLSGISDLYDVATLLQTAIRTATSNDETVVYNTDHFEITSTISGKNNCSSVLRLTAPTTGTDISGAGYLDLGANATEIAGDGDDYRLVRLDEDGQIPANKLETFTENLSAKRANGIATISSKTTTTITTGFKAGVVRIKAVLDNGDFDVEISNGVFSGGAQNCNKTQAAGVSNVADYIGNVYNSGNSVNLYLLVNNITDTTFDIVSSSTGTWQPVLILWEAEI